MVYISLDRLLDAVRRYTGVRVTLSELSASTGVHRNVISKIRNQPDSRIASDYLAKLVDFFFEALRHSPQRPKESDRELMQWVLNELVTAYPDSPVYQEYLPEEVKDSNQSKSSPELSPKYLWTYYELKTDGVPAKSLRDSRFEKFSEVVEGVQESTRSEDMDPRKPMLSKHAKREEIRKRREKESQTKKK